MATALKHGLSGWDKVDPREEGFQGWETADELTVVERANDDWAKSAGRDAQRRSEQISLERFKTDNGTDVAAHSARSIAVCEVQSFAGDEAHCLAEVAGARLPVEIPAWVLRHHDLRAGMRFEWRMSEDGSIYPADVRPLPSPRLSAAEEEERQRLWREYLADPAKDIWDNPEE